MKIAYLIQYFGPPDNSYASGRSYDFAIEWAKKGHEVWIICSDAYLIDKSKVIEFNQLNITIDVIKQPYQNEYSIKSRIWAYLIFSIKALILLIQNPNRYSILYASSTPLTVGIVGLIQKVITQKKWIFEIRDLWPDFPLEVLGLEDTLRAKILHFIEKCCYSSSSTVICLSPLVKEKLIKGKRCSEKKIEMIPNGYSDLKLEKVEKKENLYVYEGALGKANGINWLINFFEEILLTDSSASIYIAGFGIESKKILKWIQQNEFKSRILFAGIQSRDEVNKVLKRAKFSLITFSEFKSLKYNSPNKLFDVIPARLIPITNKQEWIGDLSVSLNGLSNTDPKVAAKKSVKGVIKNDEINKEILTKYSRSYLALKTLSVILKSV